MKYPEHNQTPDARNNGPRSVEQIPLRSAMRETLLEMYAQSEEQGLTFQGYLAQHLENLAVDYRSKKWQEQQAAKNGTRPDRKQMERTGGVYTQAALEVLEQRERANSEEIKTAAPE